MPHARGIVWFSALSVRLIDLAQHEKLEILSPITHAGFCLCSDGGESRRAEPAEGRRSSESPLGCARLSPRMSAQAGFDSMPFLVCPVKIIPFVIYFLF